MRKNLCAIFVLSVAVSLAYAQNSAAGNDAPLLFERGMNALSGSGATQSEAGAIDYLRRSADLGYSPAQVVLGSLYETGHGVTPEPGRALDWYKKAAQQDDPLAEWLAARMILTGAVPPRDLNQAAKWLEQASTHDNPFAEYLLGKVAFERSNYAVASAQFHKAADQGLPQAQLQFALLLRDGHGVAVDKSEAYVWMLVSRSNGGRVNDSDLQSLEADLGSAQVEQAKGKARDVEALANRAVASRGCTGWPGEFDDIPAPPPPDVQRFCR